MSNLVNQQITSADELARQVNDSIKMWNSGLERLVQQLIARQSATVNALPNVVQADQNPLYPVQDGLNAINGQPTRVQNAQPPVQNAPNIPAQKPVDISTSDWLQNALNRDRIDSEQRRLRMNPQQPATQPTLNKPQPQAPKKVDAPRAPYVPYVTGEEYALPGVPWNTLSERDQSAIRAARQSLSPQQLENQDRLYKLYSLGGVHKHGGNGVDVVYKVPDDVISKNGGDGVDVVYKVPDDEIPQIPVNLNSWTPPSEGANLPPWIPSDVILAYQQELQRQYNEAHKDEGVSTNDYAYHIQTVLPPIQVTNPDDLKKLNVTVDVDKLTTVTTTNGNTNPKYWPRPPSTYKPKKDEKSVAFPLNFTYDRSGGNYKQVFGYPKSNKGKWVSSRTIYVVKNTPFTLKLGNNASTGSSIVCRTSTSNIKEINTEFTPLNENVIGSGGTEYHTFVANSSGDIYVFQGRMWEKQTMKVPIFTFNVKVVNIKEIAEKKAIAFAVGPDELPFIPLTRVGVMDTIKRLQHKKDIVILGQEVRLILDYPLTKPVLLRFKSDQKLGCTRQFLVENIANAYQRIYETMPNRILPQHPLNQLFLSGLKFEPKNNAWLLNLE